MGFSIMRAFTGNTYADQINFNELTPTAYHELEDQLFNKCCELGACLR